jgi:hypothetical protein
MSVVVELTGDEAQLLRSMQKTIRKQAEMEAKLKQTEGAGSKMGESLKGDFGKVRTSSDQALKGSLRDLRKLGPEGRQMADALRGHFRTTGQAGERSMESILAELRKIDPEAARVAGRVKQEFGQAATQSESAFKKFGKSAIGQITGIVGAYVGVQQAVQQVTKVLREQRELLKEAKDAQIELAQAQQEAAKNLAGLSLMERFDLLSTAPGDIASATGFPDASKITTALGDVASAGESDPERIRNAVFQAARLTRLTPEALPATAGAASAVGRLAGLDDVRDALALVQTTGTQARITDPTQLQKTLPGAVGQIAATVREQDPREAAREGAAFFAQATQMGQDVRGDTSRQFVSDFAGRMRDFFTDLDEERIDARSRLSTLRGRDDLTEAQQLEQSRLREFLQASETVEDPGKFFERLRILQESEALERQFVGEGFGEKQFQTFLKEVFDEGGDLAQALRDSKETIRANAKFFEQEAEEQQGATPALSLAASQAATAGNIQGFELRDTEGATLAQIRESVGEVLDRTRQGFTDRSSSFTSWGFLQGGTAAEEAVDAIGILSERINRMQEDGVTDREANQIKLLDQEIRNLTSFIRRQGQLGVLSDESLEQAIAEVERRLRGTPQGGLPGSGPRIVAPSDVESDAFQKMLDALESIAAATAATRDNTQPQPRPATPALSNQQP